MKSYPTMSIIQISIKLGWSPVYEGLKSVRESDDPGFPHGGKKVISQQAMKDISYKKVSQYNNVNNINQMRLILGTCLIHKGSVSVKWPFDFHFSKWDGWMDGWMPSQNCFHPLHCPLARKVHLWDFKVQLKWTMQMVRMPNPYQVDYSVNGYTLSSVGQEVLGWNSSKYELWSYPHQEWVHHLYDMDWVTWCLHKFSHRDFKSLRFLKVINKKGIFLGLQRWPTIAALKK